jgi:hypothetical protein
LHSKRSNGQLIAGRTSSSRAELVYYTLPPAACRSCAHALVVGDDETRRKIGRPGASHRSPFRDREVLGSDVGSRIAPFAPGMRKMSIRAHAGGDRPHHVVGVEDVPSSSTMTCWCRIPCRAWP